MKALMAFLILSYIIGCVVHSIANSFKRVSEVVEDDSDYVE